MNRSSGNINDSYQQAYGLSTSKPTKSANKRYNHNLYRAALVDNRMGSGFSEIMIGALRKF